LDQEDDDDEEDDGRSHAHAHDPYHSVTHIPISPLAVIHLSCSTPHPGLGISFFLGESSVPRPAIGAVTFSEIGPIPVLATPRNLTENICK
jgi:hypothetical protein